MVAGMGRRMRQASATVASGWIPAFFGRDLLPTQVAELRKIRADAALDPNAFTVIVGPNMAVDHDLRRGREAAASNLAWYIAAMGTYYADSLRMQGFADEVEAVIAANPTPKPGSCVIPSEAETLMEQLWPSAHPRTRARHSPHGTRSATSRRYCSRPDYHASNCST
jgi:alkanesulfonate monooxygenase SsuD/methylene tetrahydromethanopterin reductase-like flavin-dependent oxidoreductase (luciferase family)